MRFKVIFQWIKSILFLPLVLIIAQSEAKASQLAFPGAEGFGRFTSGGRGGAVCEVTNLKDYKTGTTPVTGSLRMCVEDSKGPRTVVFRVSGTITLASPELYVKNGQLTIAGQTAPGEGITIKGGDLTIFTGDVIVRYLRIRSGPVSGVDGNRIQAITIYSISKYGPISDVILDHVSASWGIDETVVVFGDVNNVTVQWSIISEGVRNPRDPSARSTQQPTGKGLLLAGKGAGPHNFSAHHNFLANHWDRSPKFSGGNIDFVGNTIYNSRISSNLDPSRGILKVNYENNYFKRGPSTEWTGPPIRLYGGKPDGTVWPYAAQSLLFAKNNVETVLRPLLSVGSDNDLIGTIHGGWKSNVSVSQPFDYPNIHLEGDTHQISKAVIEKAGASFPKRDAVDQRLAHEFKNGTGSIINDPLDVGGWPQLPVQHRPSNYDTDHDGMPNAWETKNGLDPSDPTDGPKDRDGDGYTNLEEYLNGVLLSESKPTTPESHRPNPPTQLLVQ